MAGLAGSLAQILFTLSPQELPLLHYLHLVHARNLPPPQSLRGSGLATYTFNWLFNCLRLLLLQHCVDGLILAMIIASACSA